MITEQLKNWLKVQAPELAGKIRCGGVDGNAEYFLGVCPAGAGSRAHLCLGGAACTPTDTLAARLLLRWGKSQPEAEREARALWGLFYGLTSAEMDGATVYAAEPGSGPVPIGYGADGVYEYVINLTLIYKRE